MKNLAKLRRRKGLTQVQLAKKLKTTQPAISKWESNGKNVRPSTLKRIADAIGCKESELV